MASLYLLREVELPGIHLVALDVDLGVDVDAAGEVPPWVDGAELGHPVDAGGLGRRAGSVLRLSAGMRS